MFVRKKRIYGREYHYLVTSTRVDGKVKKIERYLGLNPPSKSDLKRYEIEFDMTKEFLLQNKDVMEKIKDKYSKRIRSSTKDQLMNFEEDLVTRFTFETSRIEGSTLSYKDTKMLLEDGITPCQKPMRDIREAENHKTAYLYMKNYPEDINKGFILHLHALLKKDVTEDAGSFRNAQVRVGSIIPINAKLVEAEIDNLIKWYNSNKRLHPLELAPVFHCNFERIHPFFDGNGRIGRLLLNFILMKKGFPMIIIQNKNKRRYYTALKRADDGNYLYMMRYLLSELEMMHISDN